MPVACPYQGARSRFAALAVAFTTLTGLVQVREATAWPTDVLAGYVVGAIFLAILASIVRWLAPAVDGLPFMHAALIPHDEDTPHAHALTSTILFRGETVAKIYAPGFLPRALYWLAFQAPFAYERNLLALRAAVLRRTLAGLLTEYWYGSNRVARAVGIEAIAGRPALIGEFVDGREPRDKDAAHQFLRDLSDRFDEAGLPTWQIDPRQPRSLGNVLERPDGSYTVIDLESGLVSPLASPRAWWHAIRRGLVPIYDDVYFDLTRAYIEDHAQAIRSASGETWLQHLRTTLDDAETAARDWHKSEPRIWSRLVGGLWAGFGVRTWPERIRAHAAEGRDRASRWLEEAVDAWRADGRLTEEDDRRLRAQIESPEFQAALPHFGVHMATSIVLRFPIGSIVRAAYVLAFEVAVTVRLLVRRIDLDGWRRTVAIHSPFVLLLAAIPGIGAFSYLASRPIRSNRLLCRVAIDAAALKLPKHIYQHSGLRPFIVGRVGPEAANAACDVPLPAQTTLALPEPATLGRLFCAVSVLLFAADLLMETIDALAAPSFLGWTQLLRIFDLNSEASLGTWLAVVGLALCAIVLLAIAAITYRFADAFARHWLALAIIVLGFSVDEQAKFHDISIGAQVREYFTLPGVLYFGWVLAAFASIVVIGLAYRRFFFALPIAIRLRFLLASATYVAGEVGVEMFSGWYTDHHGGDGWTYAAITTTEEFLGLLGVGIALYALLSYVYWQFGEIRFRFGAARRVPEAETRVGMVVHRKSAMTHSSVSAQPIGDSHASR